MNIYVHSLFSVWLLLINCTLLSAGWFGSCCEKEGWYYLDGGPFSWLFLDNLVDDNNLYEYIKQKDYQAAKSAATNLISRKSAIFVSNTNLEFHMPSRTGSGILRTARMRGETYSLTVYHDAVVKKEGKRVLNKEEQEFVNWAINETNKLSSDKSTKD